MKRLKINGIALSGTLLAAGATLAACGGTQPPPHTTAKSSELPTEGTAAQGPTAEQRRVVEAFAGQWLYHSTITMPDGKPVRAELPMTCASTAGGKANVCTLAGEIPGAGPMEATVLVGVDRLDNKVHFMAMTSDDELHDHVCSWQDAKSLACDPLQGGLGGQAITEELSFTFDADQSSFKSVVKFADGKQMVFEAVGGRSSAVSAKASQPVAASPEQKRLVETFLGSWSWDGAIVLPSGAQRGAKLELQCQKAAGGKATLCRLGSKELAGRPFEASILIGHDPFDKSVHLMMMSSDDEVWHRPCAWKGDTLLACGPQRTGVLGMPVTSELTFDFAGARGSTRWLTDLGDGKTCTLTAQMSR